MEAQARNQSIEKIKRPPTVQNTGGSHYHGGSIESSFKSLEHQYTTVLRGFWEIADIIIFQSMVVSSFRVSGAFNGNS